MKCKIEHGLVCDIVKYDVDNKQYYKLVVYSDGRLVFVSIPAESVENWEECISQYTDLECTMSTYDGKAKFKIAE